MSYNDYRPVTVSITPDTSAYTSGDVVGGKLTLTMNTTRGLITGVVVSVGEASKALAGTIYFYRADSTITLSTIADNAAFAPVHNDNKTLLGYITLGTAATLNSRNVYFTQLTTPINYATETVYAYYVTTSATTFSASQNVTVDLIVVGES